MYRYEIYCRWCQKHHRTDKYLPKGGFCSSRCKQAHYRAYKKWVTNSPAEAWPDHNPISDIE